MAEKNDDKVISLAERRGEKSQNKAKAEKNAAARAASDAGADASPVPGKMVWLFCPTCKSLEYTEMLMGGGRTHNPCGTIVEEYEADLDLRAEYTIAQVNLERLNILEEIVEGQRQRFEEYKKRLLLAAGKNMQPYEMDDEKLKDLPIAEVDALGLLVSDFFISPARQFKIDEEPPPEDSN